MPTGEKQSEDVQAPCQGISGWDEPCTLPATKHCERCGLWLCGSHFGDPDWHPCACAQSHTL